MKCPACGCELAAVSKFCPHCGADLMLYAYADIYETKNSFEWRHIVAVAVALIIIANGIAQMIAYSDNSHKSVAPAPIQTQPPVNQQPQPTQWLLGEAPPPSRSANRTTLTPAQKPIKGYRLSSYGNEPAIFMSAANFRRPGMKLYINSDVDTYQLFATYISSDDVFNKVTYADGSTGSPMDVLVDGLFTDYIAPE